MIICANVLDDAQHRSVSGLLETLSWRDGAKTAGPAARQAKQNEQADLSTKSGQILHELLRKRIETHSVFQAAALPRRISPLLISRTRKGGGYGAHTDNALMGERANRLRTDLSFTLFLSDPETYSGGELSVEREGSIEAVKPMAGDLALYASGDVHAVQPVNEGERIACVGWVESYVRRVDQRRILFDLANVQTDLKRKKSLSHAEQLSLQSVYDNLVRMWAET